MIVDILVSLLISKGIFLMLHYIKCEICCKLLAGNHLWKIEFSFNSWITIHFTMNEYWKKSVFFFCRAQKSEVCIIWIQSYHLYYSNSYFLSFSYLYWNIKKKKKALSLWLDSPPLPSLLPSFFFSFLLLPPFPDFSPVDCRKFSGTLKDTLYRSIKRNITQIRKTAEQQFYNQTK